MSAWIAPQSPPDDAARIAELRAELADLMPLASWNYHSPEVIEA